MSKLIAGLVGVDNKSVRSLLDNLEKQTGGPGIDLRLTSEICTKLHIKMRSLGLDPKDTTPHELYNTLMSLTSLHEQFLIKRLKINQLSSADDLLQATVELIERMNLPRSTWTLKPGVCKDIIKALPPKNLMKMLGFRSLDSMIKREDPGVLIAASELTEPAGWQDKLQRKYQKLVATDFELRDIKVSYLAGKKWQTLAKLDLRKIPASPDPPPASISSFSALDVAMATSPSDKTTSESLVDGSGDGEVLRKSSSLIAVSKHAGVIAVMPPSLGVEPGLVLFNFLRILSKISEIQEFSINNLDYPEIAGQNKLTAEEVLYHLEPALHFWHDINYVGLVTSDGAISFSLHDAATNLVNHHEYQNRSKSHMQRSLMSEVTNRYGGLSLGRLELAW